MGVDMSSTGEVGCLGDDTSQALLKSMLSVGQRIPAKNILLSTGSAKQKVDMLDAAHMLVEHGYKIRRAAIDLNVPLITNSRLASAFIYAFCATKLEDIDIKAWGEY